MSTVDVLAVHIYFTKIEQDLHPVHHHARVIFTDLELCFCCTLYLCCTTRSLSACSLRMLARATIMSSRREYMLGRVCGFVVLNWWRARINWQIFLLQVCLGINYSHARKLQRLHAKINKEAAAIAGADFADHHTLGFDEYESIAAQQADTEGGCEGAGIVDVIEMANTMAAHADRVAACKVPPALISE
jgi:hypothetical protein